MKKLLFCLLLVTGCVPVKYVYVDPKDSTNVVEVRKRIIYEDFYQPQIPIYFYNGIYNRPFVIQRPIVVPRRPVIQHNRNYVQPWTPNRNSRQPFPPRPQRPTNNR